MRKNLCRINEKDQDVIFQLIKLSYDHLPYLLKKSFTFLSLFQKDSIINKTTLIRLWIAKGFVSDGDIEDYLTTLLHISLFQDVHRDFDGNNIFGFRMHDQMHEFATTISNKLNQKVMYQIMHLEFHYICSHGHLYKHLERRVFGVEL